MVSCVFGLPGDLDYLDMGKATHPDPVHPKIKRVYEIICWFNIGFANAKLQ